jgi:uncharacterized protein (TIGR03085 family)
MSPDNAPRALADQIVTERRSLLETLRAVGPDASTLAGDWSASTLARHIVAQDRLAGLPAFLARGLVARTGLRLNELHRRSAPLAALVNGPSRPWASSLKRLDRPPPAAVLRPSIAPITLWEHFVHHEDIRRPNNVPRVSSPELSATVPWLLRYNRSRLRGASLRVVSSEGTEWRVGHGREVVLAGALSELVLWLSGRHESAEVEVRGDMTVAHELCDRFAV